ncbi:head GIN domain-containing protein [Larkinella sp. VNQ87]|uniref:head GIN domain-containing protein n=1 Tax=Larkinella sp. VNQ87 TaxID=3400921 RepID=UPI003C0D53A2
MKSFLYLTALLTAFVAGLSGCNREDVGPLQEGEKAFLIANFDRLEVHSGMDVTVTQGSGIKIMAKGDQRNLDDLEVENRNGTLYINYRNFKNRKYATAFTISMPTLRGVKYTGGVHGTVQGFADLANLDVDLSGGSHGNFEVIAKRTDIVASGGSKVTFTEPKVTTGGDDSILSLIDQVTLDVSGGSKVMAFEYPAHRVTAKASGGSQAEVNATESLTAEASGGSKVRYRGNPANLNQNTSGGGKVERD